MMSMDKEFWYATAPQKVDFCPSFCRESNLSLRCHKAVKRSSH